MTAIFLYWLLRVQRTRCIRMMRLGIAVTLLAGLGFILTHDGLYQRLTFPIRRDQSCIKPFCEMRSNASNLLIALDTRNGHMSDTKGPTQNRDIIPTDGTKTGFTPELPLEMSQPERLRNLPYFDCHVYTCEKPPNFPELRLNETPVVPSARNVTPGRSSLVFYNRVNKCGSKTLRAIARGLEYENHFQTISSEIHRRRGLSWKAQKKLAINLTLMQIDKPLHFDRHVYFINFTRYGLDPPIWINMVRQPVERFISFFYYYREIKSSQPRYFNDVHFRWFDKDLNDCVRMGDPECDFRPGGMKETMLTFFCGHHPACMEIGNRGALQRAKRHVETEYSVVGVLEDLPTSMRVLEHYVPGYFRGASSVLAKKVQVDVHRNAGTATRNVTEETMQLLRNMMALDIDFYDFAKQRLHLQSQRIPE